MNVIINIAVPMLAFAGGMVFEYFNRSRELRHLQDLVRAQDELLDLALPGINETDEPSDSDTWFTEPAMDGPVDKDSPFTIKELAPKWYSDAECSDGYVWPQLKLIKDEHAAQRAHEDQAMRLGNGDKADQW